MPFFVASEGFDPTEIKVDAANFMPLNYVDENFDMGLEKESIMG